VGLSGRIRDGGKERSVSGRWDEENEREGERERETMWKREIEKESTRKLTLGSQCDW